MSFSTYAAPLAHLTFSTEFFNSLKISQIADLSYPSLAEVGSVSWSAFSHERPSSAAATIVTPGEILPHFSDLLPITREIEAKYEEGMRSVHINFTHLGLDYSVNYSFSKINLIRNICNFQPAAQECRHLLSRLELPQFQFLGPALESFCAAPFLSPIHGFFVTDFPLYKLGCLLGEKWLEEDVFNALAELSYFRRALHEKTLKSAPIGSLSLFHHAPQSLILPTTFLIDACRAHSHSKTYTAEIIALRERIQKTAVQVIAVPLAMDNHFTAFVYRPGSDSIDHGDSMHQPPPPNILPVLQWVFSGVCQPPISRITSGFIPRQGFGNGEGSCGIIAHNFIEIAIGSRPGGVRQWSGPQSQLFRDAALQDLIHYHYIASQTPGNFSTWSSNILDTSSTSIEVDVNISIGSGFNDFNNFTPLKNHPIVLFCDSKAAHPEFESLQPTKVPTVPTVDQLRSMPPDLPLLPPFILANSHSISAPATRKVMFSPTRPGQKRRRRSLDGLSSALLLGSTNADEISTAVPDIPGLTKNFLDLCSPSPKQRSKVKPGVGQSLKAEPVKPDINLCTPVRAKRPKISLTFTDNSNSDTDSEIQPVTPVKIKREKPDGPPVFDLCTPTQVPGSTTSVKHEVKTEKLGAPSTPVNIKKEKPDGPPVIDLCTPTQVPGLITSVKHEIKIEKLGAPFVINVSTPDKKPHLLTRPPVKVAPGVVRLGALFNSEEDAQSAIYAREERLGHRWRRGQSKQDNWNKRKKLTLRCNHYYRHIPVHSLSLDPADHCQGKSIRTSCNAHVNITRQPDGKWKISLVDWEHNHAPEVPEGAPFKRPPTDKQKAAIAKLATATSQTFTRGQMAEVLDAQTGDSESPLEPRQITNIMNKARSDVRKQVEKLGGDMNAIIASLQQKMQETHGWNYDLKLDEDSVVTGIWWQSPTQAELCKRYGDVLINDNTYNRNRTGYPLNIGVGIDGHYSSRNLWYALHAIEDEDHHSWVLQCHLNSAGYPPESIISDRSRPLIAAVKRKVPEATHNYCVNHLEGNVDQKLGRLLPPGDWLEFKNGFWEVYRAVSPEDFDEKWNALTTRFPQAKTYLDNELYPCREQWAWAFTSFQFTCGVRTNGRVEVENRVNKAIGGPKKTLKELFDGLNKRSDGQTVQELIRVRDSSRRQHPTNIETIFPGPLAIIRQFIGPFGLQTCFRQMELSVFYSVNVLVLPDGMRDWNEYAITVGPVVGFTWEGGEETRMLNTFENDNAHISTKWLLRLVKSRGLRVEHLLCITHDGTDTFHMLAILPNNNYVCDCCMGMYVGLPCRHYFRALRAMKSLKFNIGVIRPRWYQDNTLNTEAIPLVYAREAQIRRLDVEVPALQKTKAIPANPLEPPRTSTPALPPTQTLPARTVFHEAHAALAPLTNSIQTQEQLDELLDDLQELRASRYRAAEEGRMREPAVLNPKGRPREQRMTGALEGPPRGGGATSGSARLRGTAAARKCGACREVGHTRAKCPHIPS